MNYQQNRRVLVLYKGLYDFFLAKFNIELHLQRKKIEWKGTVAVPFSFKVNFP